MILVNIGRKMAVFQETPQAGWEEEASFNAVGKTPVAAAPDNKSEGPKQRNQSIPRKRNGSLLGWLLSSSESQAGEFTLMHTGWVAKQGIYCMDTVVSGARMDTVVSGARKLTPVFYLDENCSIS